MAKRKPKSKPKRPRKPRPRTCYKDERGIPLTDDRRPFAIIPSALLPAMSQPPGTPSKGTLKRKYQKPTTTIPELQVIEFTEFAFESVILAIEAAGEVQRKRMNPKGGANLRYRIELAAAFMAQVLEHSYDAAIATGNPKPNDFMWLALNIAIRRAQEIYGQEGA